MEFLEEVRKNNKFRDLMHKHPDYATKLFARWVNQYAEEWPILLDEITRERQFHNLSSIDHKSSFRPVALIPNVVGEWIRFLYGEGEAAKDSMKKYLKSHPQYWVKPNIFNKGK